MQRQVLTDALGRKQKTIYTDDDGRVSHENQYMYASDNSKIPNAGLKTYFRQDGTKLSTESSVYDEKMGIFRPLKKTHYDSFERKEKTDHFNEMGQKNYTNEYIYENKEAREPTACIQIEFKEGKKSMKKIALYDKETGNFRTTKISFYDSVERPVLTTEYDKEGYKRKEKAYRYEKNGSVFVHRKEFNKGNLVTSGDFVAVNGCLLPCDKEKERSIVSLGKGDTTSFFQQVYRTPIRR